MKLWLNVNEPISGLRYFALGVMLFALKYNLDRAVAILNGRSWGLFNYWVPLDRAASIRSFSVADRGFLTEMIVLALPFITVGVFLTIRRLRTLRLPGWFIVFFFFPFLNLILFAFLSLAPPPEGGLGRWIPETKLGSAMVAVLITIPIGIAMTIFGATILAQYAWGLFVGIPFSIGLGAALIHGYHHPRRMGECVSVAVLVNLVLGGAVLMFALEGLVCLLMAAPIAISLGALGGLVGYALQQRPKEHAPAMLLIVLLFSPGFMTIECLLPREAPMLKVVTAIEVNAPPERVWKNVVAFTELPSPTELFFRAGIAYPIRARIQGSGVGAVRKCEFSTGPFIEPIQVWDEPRLLRFSVISNPQPMREWTPYPHIEPRHLQGYLVSRQGQFLLTPLPGGRTRLEGTTWYQHHLWPASYWQFWSDAILHRIHLRVLRHVKEVSERSPTVASR